MFINPLETEQMFAIIGYRHLDGSYKHMGNEKVQLFEDQPIRTARKALEERTGKSVISEKKAVELNTVFTKMIEEVSSEDLKEV